MEYPLGAAPLEPDDRDFQLSQSIALEGFGGEPAHRSWKNNRILDQGIEGACVGFALTAFLNSAPRTGNKSNGFAFDLYHEITENDEFRGDWQTGQVGTSLRAGADALLKRGHIEAYAFSSDIEEVKLWLSNVSPVAIAVPWYRSMDEVVKGFCRVDRRTELRGWHAVLIDGLGMKGRGENHCRFANSWGPKWGRKGKAAFSFPGLKILLETPGASALTSVEVKA